eukprot:342918_1
MDDTGTPTLKIYLNNELQEPSGEQTKKILQILNNADEDKNESRREYKFRVNDTFLHAIVKEQIVQKTKHIINHKVTLAVVLISYVISSQFSPLTWYIAELLHCANDFNYHSMVDIPTFAAE